MLDKKQIISEILKELKREFATLAKNAMEAKEAATSEESRAENKYDTRGLEASYLAGAQAKRAQELRQIITQFEKLQPKTFTETTPIGSTALVQVRVDDEEDKWFFMLAQKGGMRVRVGEDMVSTLSINSPLGKLLMGKVVGDDFEFSSSGEPREYVVIQVL